MSAATRIENVSTRASMRRSNATSTGSGSLMPCRPCTRAHASAIAARAPSAPRIAPSTRSCWINRARLAPIASLTLISRRRAEARASSMPATFAHAINSTSPTIVMRPAAPIDRMPPACGTSSRTSLVGTAAILRSLLVCTLAASICRPINATFALACAAVTPGLRRPFTNIHRMPRRSRRVVPIGDGTESLIPAGSTSSTY